MILVHLFTAELGQDKHNEDLWDSVFDVATWSLLGISGIFKCYLVSTSMTIKHEL